MRREICVIRFSMYIINPLAMCIEIGYRHLISQRK